MSMSWFKLHHEIVDDIKIRRFSSQEKWAWVVLLCLASKSSDRGTITADNDDLADYCEFNCTQDWLYYRDKLIAKGMLEINAMGGLDVVHWGDRQAKKPSDDPARIKERVAKSRAKKKTETVQGSQEDVTRYEALQAECNADVSPQIRLDQTRSEETRSDQDQIKVENTKTSKSNKLLPDSEFEIFRETWNQHKPDHWAECQSLGKERINALKKFATENGDRAMQIWTDALAYARSDKFWSDPARQLSIDNFLTNNKPVGMAEKASKVSPSGNSEEAAQARLAIEYERTRKALEAL